MRCIEAQDLRKNYGKTIALDGVNLQIDSGRIVGVFGLNGAGKTTLLNALLGLIPCDGSLRVLGQTPWKSRHQLMLDACFVADVAVLPRWMKVAQVLDYLQGVHPRFSRERARSLLAKTSIPVKGRIGELSKGMVAQLHLSLALAIDAKLLVLDEPTLGLDLQFHKQFYDSLLSVFHDQTRTVLIATHHVDEVQHILTDAVFMRAGRVTAHHSMDELHAQFQAVQVEASLQAAAQALNPARISRGFGRDTYLYHGVDPQALTGLGDVRTPALSDLFFHFAGESA